MFFGSIIDHIIEVQTDTGESSSSSTLELSWYGAVGGMTHGVTHKSSYKSVPPAQGIDLQIDALLSHLTLERPDDFDDRSQSGRCYQIHSQIPL